MEAIDTIKSKIHSIRGVQVMFDRDLAELYEVETRSLKQAVKRNSNRFPQDFLLVLTEAEIELMVSQSVIPSRQHVGGARPYAFTEQGVAMIASILKSNKAIEININIMRAFVAMRKFLMQNANIFQKFQQIDQKLIEHDTSLDRIFRVIESNSIMPERGIFFEGQIFDSYKFISDLIRSAKTSIILIDNYIDESVLAIFSKKKDKVKVTLYTKEISKQLEADKDKFNKQYGNLEIKEFNLSHDRFLIIDNQMYHVGASLKDLGKKWFAFSKFDKEGLMLIDKLNNQP
jgi:hypothetical protein